MDIYQIGQVRPIEELNCVIAYEDMSDKHLLDNRWDIFGHIIRNLQKAYWQTFDAKRLGIMADGLIKLGAKPTGQTKPLPCMSLQPISKAGYHLRIQINKDGFISYQYVRR